MSKTEIAILRDDTNGYPIYTTETLDEFRARFVNEATARLVSCGLDESTVRADFLDESNAFYAVPAEIQRERDAQESY